MKWSFVALVLLASCMEANTFTCPSGLLCPPGTVCDEARDRCISPDQTAACDGLGEGDACTVSEAPGRCSTGVCIPLTCGDGVVSAGEQCDGADLAGKTCESLGYYGEAGLGCDASCLFDRTGCEPYGICGDGTKQAAEACDKATDGTIDDGGENLTCVDFGYYAAPGLDCTSACTFDARDCTGGTCGDDVWQVGTVEQCDGGLATGQSCLLRGGDFGHLLCTSACGHDPRDCRDFDWQTEISGTTATLIDVFAISPFDIVAVGVGGVIRHNRGAGWQRDESGVTTDLNSVWASGPSDIYAVGNSGGIVHYDGTSWSPVTVPQSFQYLTVNGSGPNDVWVAGNTSTILHYDGSTWTAMTTTAATFREIYAVSPTEAYAVGYSGTGLWTWNGTTWSKDTAVAGDPWLERVWASGPNDIWIVGQSGRIEHKDASGWTSVTAPAPFTLGLWGSPSGNIFLATFTAGVHVWNGSGWTQFPGSPGSSYSIHGTDQELYVAGPGGALQRFAGTERVADPIEYPENAMDLWGTSATNMYSVSGSHAVQRFDGVRWETFEDAVNDQNSIEGIWGFADNDITVIADGPESYRWNGATWTALAIDGGARLTAFMGKGWGTSSTNLYATGIVNPVGGGIPHGGIYHYDGTSWKLEVETGNLQYIYEVWGLAANDAYGVGQGGRIFHLTSGWNQETSNTTATLRSVWASGANDVWAVGDGGTIVRRTNGTWAPVTSNTTAQLLAVAGFSATDIYAAGAGGVILHYNGTSWAPVSSPTTGAIRSLFRAGTTMFGASDSGRLFFDGTAWSSYGAPGRTIHATALKDHTHGITVGEVGMLLLRNGTTAPIASPRSVTYYGVTQLAADDQFVAVGERGTAVSFNGTAFTVHTTGVTTTLRSVFATSLTQAIIVGAGGTALKLDGTVTSESSGTTEDLYGVHGTTATNLIAVGDNGTIRRYTGTWSVMTAPGSADLRAVWMAPSGEAFAVGLGGATYHYNGSAWSIVPSLTTVDLHAVTGRSATDVIAVGVDGYIAHWDGQSWAQVRSATELDDYRAVAATKLHLDVAGDGSTHERFLRSLPW